MEIFCIDTKNHEGKRVIFTQTQREKKWSKHPELRDDKFIKRIQNAIEDPNFIYEDMVVQGRLVYYKYEYSVNGRAVYTKVVLNSRIGPYFVVTAYRPDYVKERGKTKLLYGQDNY